MPDGQTRLTFLDGLAHEANHQLVGIAATLVDFQTRVAAFQALQRDAHGSVVGVGLHLFIIESGGDVDAASRADDELAPRLGVEVEQDVALQLALGKRIGTEHSRFLVGGDERFDGAVFQVFRLQDGHDGRHTQTVVGTERRVLGLHPFAVDPRLDGVGFKVVRRFGCFLRHHVHVGLQDDAFAVLHAKRGGLPHHDVLGGVDEGFHADLLGKVKQELLYFL